MRDDFLKRVDVSDSDDAIKNSLQASLQRNRTYKAKTSAEQRAQFRSAWACLIIEAADGYRKGGVGDCVHCDLIEKIASTLSREYSSILNDGKLRFGTSQKALNLYLKFLWRLGSIPPPPHCPVDRVILKVGGISDSWTRCDSKNQYIGWIQKLRKKAEYDGLSLGDWEYKYWNKHT
jgi:hypothetical protein